MNSFGIRGHTWNQLNFKTHDRVPTCNTRTTTRAKSAPTRIRQSPWTKRREKLLSLIREDSWNSDAFIKPKIEKIASEKDSDNGSQLNLENYLPENNNGFVEDIENKISSLGLSRSPSVLSCKSSSSKQSEAASIFSNRSLVNSQRVASVQNWSKVRTALKSSALDEMATNSPDSERSFSTRFSSKSRSRKIRSRYNPQSRHLLSGFESVIAEKYNIRADFNPLPLFRHSVRIVVILIKAGGCFKSKEKLVVDDDEDVRFYDKSIGSNMRDAPIFNPSIFKADRSLKLSRVVGAYLRLHPSDRTQEHIGMIVRGLQVVLETFSDYPLDTQNALAKYSYLEVIEPGRLIMKKGDRPLRFHIIISGRALLTEVIILPTGKENIQMRGVISQGETFGDEDACFLHAGGLIHEGADFMPRKHTVISQKELQTLTLDGEDYLSIFHPEAKNKPKEETREIKPNYPEFYNSSVMVNSCIEILKKNQYLRYWPLEEIRDANPRDFRLQYFRKGTIITSGIDDMRKLIFIKHGSCQVFRQVKKNQSLRSSQILRQRTSSRNVNSAQSFFRKPTKPVFIKERRLDVGQMFGFSTHFGIGHKGLYFKNYDKVDPNVSLVSNDAEVIIFSVAFYRAHLNEQCKAVLTLNLESTPEQNYAGQLEDQNDWETYKSTLQKDRRRDIRIGPRL